MLECGKALPACDPEVATAPASSEAAASLGSAQAVLIGAGDPQTELAQASAKASATVAAAAAAGADDGGEDDDEEEEDWDCFCAKCKGTEEPEENPILLCDHEGCGRGFHRLCCDEPMSLEDLADEDEPWVCDFCSSLSEALSLIVEVDPDVDRDSIPELIAALREAASQDTCLQAGGADDDAEAAHMRRIAIAAAAGQASAGLEGEEGSRRRRQQIDYAMLNALMFGEAAAYDESEDVDYISAAGEAHEEGEDHDDDDDEDDDEDDDDNEDSLLDQEHDASNTHSVRPARRAAAIAREQIRVELERLERVKAAGAAAVPAAVTTGPAGSADTIASAVLADDDDDGSFVDGDSGEEDE
jgi:hypothetical protein